MQDLISKEKFYNWAYSDFLVNNQRGHLAEYIVASALGIDDGKRQEWDPYDLLYKNLKIEVKSAAYIQAWEQKQYSLISFDIAPTRLQDLETGKYSEERKRQSNCYIFCLLNSKERETINPLSTQQWEFYIVKTDFLNNKIPLQKTITLSALKKFGFTPMKYAEIKKEIDKFN